MDFSEHSPARPGEDAERPGACIGSWQLERELGRGAMGRVWLARHALLGTRGAVKILQRELAGRSEFVQRMMEEARAGATLRHPNVVQVFDCFLLEDGRPAFAMEYLDGPNLEQLAGRTPMEPKRARSLLLQLAAALAEVHYRGLVHRDVKPQNVMVVRTRDGDEVVKILDFGIARHATFEAGLTLPGTALGTPHYMSPEQALGAPVDFRSDVYALGILAYRLFEGRLPFEGGIQEVLLQQVESEPPPMVHAPEPLRAVVLRALAKRPAERHDTAGAFARALAEATPQGPAAESGHTLVVSSTAERVELRLSSAARLNELAQEASRRRRLFLPAATRPGADRIELRASAPGAAPLVVTARVLLYAASRESEPFGGLPGLALELEPLAPPVAAPRELTPQPAGAPVPARPSPAAGGRRPRAERFRRRFPVAFGPSESPLHTGFTTNVSASGLALTTQQPQPVGARLFLSFTHVPQGPRVHGTVVWSKTPAIRGENGAMGLRIDGADEKFFRLLMEISQGGVRDGREVTSPPVKEKPRRQVMVVEDNRDLRLLLTDAFEAEGYEVLPCADGGLAMAAMERLGRGSAVVLDLMMPLVSGWKVYEALRGSDAHRDIPVVVLSAHPDGGRLPGTHFMPKPFEINDVTALVGRLVGA